MLRLFVFFVAVLMAVIFVIANEHTTQLYLFVGEPFNVRLVSLMLFSFLIGVACASYFFLMMSFHAKKKKAREAEEDEDGE